MQTLQEREDLLRSMSDAMPDILVYQTETRPGEPMRFRYIAGREAAKRLDVTVEQSYADPAAVWACFHPEDRAAFRAAIEAANANRSVLEHELRVCVPDGSIRWSTFRSIPQYCPDGRIIRTGIALDITTRKVADLALAEQLRYSEALASCSHILLVEGADTADCEAVIQHALATLRGAVGCTRLALRLYPSPDDILRRSERIVMARLTAAFVPYACRGMPSGAPIPTEHQTSGHRSHRRFHPAASEAMLRLSACAAGCHSAGRCRRFLA